MKTSILTCFSFLFALSCWAQDPNGTWKGNLSLPNIELPLVLHVSTDEAGSPSASLDSPKQNAYGIKANTTQWNTPELVVKVNNMQMVYTGQVVGDSLKGTFKQGTFEFPLNLHRESKMILKMKRTQTVTAPFPYTSKDVTFTNEPANVTLAGTLTLPKGPIKAAAILVSGSGPQNRNSEVFEHATFEVLADYLTRQGYAILRYDDRGVNESTGDFNTATTFDLTKDAETAINYLRGLPELKKTKVGIIGHSEGGLIAAMLSNRPDFIISLAGSGLRGDQILLAQQHHALRQMNQPESFNTKILGVSQDFFAIVQDSENYIQAVQHFNEQYANDQDATVLQQARGLAEGMNPWLFDFLRINPSDYWSKVTCPVLVLNGNKDTQVFATDNVRAITTALKTAKNNKVEVKILQDINHLLQKAKTGNLDEYVAIEETINPAVLEAVKQFLATIK